MASPKEKPHFHHHFSHEHPLEHTNSTPKPNTICFGCKGRIFPGHDHYYECKKCSFFLHQICHDVPQKAGHPSDPNHHFTLHATSFSSEETTYECKACGNHIEGLYYTCHACKDYYHVLCLIVPLSLKISSHVHIVKLEFSPPYDFECDLCKEPSFRGWLYRCESCEFDAHIKCVIRSKGEEWMIAQGMDGSDHLHLQANPSQLSTSYQSSEPLFSIDFAKSLLIRDECIDHDNNNDSSNKNSDDVVVQTPKKDIRVWSEIGRESGKGKFGAYGKGTDDIAKRKSDTDYSESSCWSSLAFYLCCERM